MAMMINQRLRERCESTEDEELERIDLDALKRMEQRQVNPLKPYKEEDVDKPNEKYAD